MEMLGTEIKTCILMPYFNLICEGGERLQTVIVAFLYV